MSVSVLNAETLKQKLSEVARINVEKAVGRAALIVEGQAKLLCPVDTGALRASIHTKVEKNGTEVKGIVYTSSEYAPFVEFGTGSKGEGTYPHKIDGLNLVYRETGWTYKDPKTDEFVHTNGQVAQPFMYPALEMNKKNVETILQDSINEILKEVAK